MRRLDWFWWAAIAVTVLLVAGAVFLVQQRVTAASLGEVYPAEESVVTASEVTLSASIPRLEASEAQVEVWVDGDQVPAESVQSEADRVVATVELEDGRHEAEVVLTSDNYFARNKVSRWTFSVDTTPPMVEFVTPLGFETLSEPRIQVYAWYDEAATPTFLVDGSPLPLEVEQASFTVDLLVTQGPHDLVLEVTDEVGNTYRREWKTFADFEKPVIHAVDWPGEEWEDNQEELNLEVADNFPDGVEIDVTIDGLPCTFSQVDAFAAPDEDEDEKGEGSRGSADGANVMTTAAAAGQTAVRYVISTGELAEGRHEVRVSAVDRGGHAAELSESFVVDSTGKFGYVSMVAGAVGEDVKELQRLLKARDFYEGDYTGIFDEATEKGLLAFKTSKNLDATPILDFTTVKALVGAIVIDRTTCELTLYDEKGVVKVYGVAVGQPAWPTPVGRFRIIAMWKNPSWTPPNSSWAVGLKPVPPGPGNPLGTRWMGIDSPSIGMHGTPQAWSIGSWASHGCIRMRIKDAEDLFERVFVGTPVQIIN